jgi:hypothetical protein
MRAFTLSQVPNRLVVDAFRVGLLCSLLGTASCRRHLETAPSPAERGYCWWTAQYLAVAPAWVASRFENALSSLGLANVRKRIDADSAWASAGPSPISGAPEKATYRFLAVAYSAADSLHCAWRGIASAPRVKRPIAALSCFRTDVLIYAPRDGWTANDSINAGSRVLSLCGDVYRVALAGLER